MIREYQIRISMLWLLISVSYLLHSVYHLSDLFFGIDIKLDDATGEVPVGIHLFRIVTEIVILVMIVLTLVQRNKWFYWFSFIWSLLLVVLNSYHFVTTLIADYTNYSQVVLLAFIAAVNIILSITIYRLLQFIKTHNGN